MAYKQLVDIVEDAVALLGHTFVIQSSIINLDGTQTLTTTNTYYLNPGKKFAIGSDQYIVKSFVWNESVTVQKQGTAPDIIVTSFELPAPIFKAGTVRSTDPEVSQEYLKTVDTNRPLVYLFEPIEETVVRGNTRVGEREVPIILFIIDFSNYDDNLNEDFNQDAIKPLSNIECKWFDLSERSQLGDIKPFTSNVRRMNHNRFARTDQNGELKLIFSQQFSAIQLQMTLNIKKC